MNTNLLDLNDDVLNIIGDFVKRDNLKKELMNEEQILNGKKIRFGEWSSWIHFSLKWDKNYKGIKDKNTKQKDNIKYYIFIYIDDEILKIKKYTRNDKIKLQSKDIRMCIWIAFQRCKVVLDKYEIYLNMDDENNFLDEYLTKNKLNLKTKKYSFIY
jgi:hypothetical protein